MGVRKPIESAPVQIREIAERILLSESLAEKLAKIPTSLVDDRPGPARREAVPGRPPELKFALRRTAPAMPRAGALRDPKKRAVAHHILANHEMQALEVMAFVLLAFPEAPSDFRSGLVDIMRDEQRHTRLHIERAVELGLQFEIETQSLHPNREATLLQASDAKRSRQFVRKSRDPPVPRSRAREWISRSSGSRGSR